jgi:aspartate/methionine/tyrosine aminotransferase
VNNGYKNYVKFFGLSKDRPGMTGIRCGYCIGDNRLLAGIEKNQITRNISNGIISDYFLLLDIALRFKELSGIQHEDLKYYSSKEIENYKETISRQKKIQKEFNDRVVKKLANSSSVIDIIKPDGGNSVFFRYHKNFPAQKFVKEFLSKGLAAYPSEAFMLNHMQDGSWTRICVTRDMATLERIIDKI